MKKRNQKGLSAKISPTQTPLKFRRAREISAGFGLVEALLIIIAAGIVGFGGYYVWHTRSNKNSTKVASNSNSPKTTTTAGQNIVKIPELGIEITAPDSIKDLAYQMQPEVTLVNGKPAKYAFFSTVSLASMDSGCSVSSGPLGSLERVSGQYPSGNQYAESDYGALVKQFSSFYISISLPHATCAKNPNSVTDDKQAAQKQTFSEAVSSIKEISN